MEKLKDLLNYQEIDVQIRAIENSPEKADLLKKLETLRTNFANAKNNALKCEKQAEKLVAFYNSALELYKESAKKIEEFTKALTIEKDEKKLADIKLNLEKYRDKYAELDAKLSDFQSQSEKVSQIFKEANAIGRKAQESAKEIQEKLQSISTQDEPKVAELNKKLKAMEKKIDKELMAKYMALSDKKIAPPFFVQLDNDNCGYCRFKLAGAEISTLKTKGYYECANCGRVIYFL